MLYFDTSYLFRLYSQERGHEIVKQLPVGHDWVASACHSRAEFATIILRHRRERVSPDDCLVELHQQFLDECRAGRIRLLPLGENVLERIETALRSAPRDTFLRSADALHLACAAQNGFAEVYSSDRHLLAAAPLFVLRGVDVIAAS